MRVTNEQLEDIKNGENYGIECDEVNDTNIHAIVCDLIEARQRIQNLSDAMLEISQRPIALVCEEVRQKARLVWERSKEYL